jgi:glycosyltransferase involved in cell wall biosynthesis
MKECWAGLTWSIAHRVARVVISDSQPIDRQQTQPKVVLKRALVGRFQSAFVGGAPHVRYLATLGMPATRCFVGCDVVDNAFFGRESARSRVAKPPGAQRPVLLSCIRLLPIKNVLGVLRTLAEHSSDWSWLIAGSGPQRDEIESSVDALGLNSRVCLLGQVDYAELPAVYARADAYLQPSLSEPWGLAVNEAMACGLPIVVSTACGCHEDLVQEGVNGFTFDPYSPDGLAIALERLGQNSRRWSDMGAASSNIVASWGLDLYARSLWRASSTAMDGA